MRLCVRCQHSQFWPNQTCFVDYYSPFWGPEAISIVVEPQGVRTSWSSTLPVLADSGPFHRFWVPKRFPWLSNSKVSLRVGHQQSQFGPILAHFLDYYSLFWGLGVISMIDKPRGMFTCPSSTLTILADSSPFRGILLAVLGSQSDFRSC